MSIDGPKKNIAGTLKDNLNIVKSYLNLPRKIIASATHVDETTVSRYLNGVTEIPEMWASEFCSAFHVEEEWFRNGAGSPVFTEPPRIMETENAGERLKQMRIELGLSQQDVYAVLSITRTMYSRLENGHARLTPENAKKLEDMFACGAEWLLYGNVEKKNYPLSAGLMNWLWQHEDERKQLWEKMKSGT